MENKFHSLILFHYVVLVICVWYNENHNFNHSFHANWNSSEQILTIVLFFLFLCISFWRPVYVIIYMVSSSLLADGLRRKAEICYLFWSKGRHRFCNLQSPGHNQRWASHTYTNYCQACGCSSEWPVDKAWDRNDRGNFSFQSVLSLALWKQLNH